MRSHDLIRLLDEPGPERWRPLCKYLFWIYPGSMNSGEPGAGSPGALLHSQRSTCESGRFGIPATEFRASVSLSLGKLKSRTRPDSAEVSVYMIRWPPRLAVDQRRRRAMWLESAS